MGLLDNILNQIMPGPSKNPYGGLLNDDQYQQYRQQQLMQNIGGVGDFLARMSVGDPSGGRGRSGQGGLLDMMRMQQYQQGQQDRQTGQQKDARWAERFGGDDPTKGINWKTGRPGAAPPGVSPQQSQALGLLGRERGEGLLAAQAFQKEPARKTAKDVAGYQRDLATGERVFPGAEKPAVPQYGTPQFDTQLGKFYQVNPKTGKREYTSPQTGMEITTPEGLTIRTGVRTGSTGGMEKRTRGDIEKKLVGAREGLARLRSIAAKYRPEFQEIPTRLGVAWTGLKARFGKGGVSSEDRQALTEFADYRRDAISNINLYIKDITGAQMSATETDRLRLATPDPGEGIFGGDDPITFEAKLGSAIRDIEKATVRYEHYLSQGITDPEVMARQSPLDSMRVYVNPGTGERIVEINGQWVPMK